LGLKDSWPLRRPQPHASPTFSPLMNSTVPLGRPKMVVSRG
jgi:hypothetical protein